MNKTIVAVMLQALLITFCCFCTKLSASPLENTSLVNEFDVDAELMDRLNNIESIVDIEDSKELRDRVKMYVKDYPKGAEELLGRVSIYFPLFENKLREKNLPNDLKYLSVIESALRPAAKSKSGAAGLWQFIRGTGRMYGLKITRSVDERYDPIKSTEAALNYLNDLHERYNDWTLAIAAYNCGPGNVNKAIRRANGKTKYWEIRRFLPHETREYIPRFIAATYLMKYYHRHNLTPRMPDDVLLNTATTKVYDQIKFDELVQETGLTKAQIRFLNPSYLRNYIPESEDGHFLTLPEDQLFGFIERRSLSYNTIYHNTGKPLLTFQNRTLSDLIELPQLSMAFDSGSIGEKVPMRQSTDLSKYNQQGKRSAFYQYHKLAKRESILDIVQQYDDLDLEEVLALNNITIDNPPLAGSIIKLRRK